MLEERGPCDRVKGSGNAGGESPMAEQRVVEERGPTEGWEH